MVNVHWLQPIRLIICTILKTNLKNKKKWQFTLLHYYIITLLYLVKNGRTIVRCYVRCYVVNECLYDVVYEIFSIYIYLRFSRHSWRIIDLTVYIYLLQKRFVLYYYFIITLCFVSLCLIFAYLHKFSIFMFLFAHLSDATWIYYSKKNVNFMD